LEYFVMGEADTGGAQGVSGRDFAARHALQVAGCFRWHSQPFHPLLGDSMFDGPLISQDFRICHYAPLTAIYAQFIGHSTI
jgi:hypothetical protein